MDKGALEVVFPERDYRLAGKYAKPFSSSAAAGGHLRLRAYFSPSSQYFLLELTKSIFFNKKQQTTKTILRQFPLEAASQSCHHRTSIFLK